MSDLVVEHLEVRYGDLIGVADVSMRIENGQIVALLGSNGAGKTTTLNAIAGLVRVSKGRVTWRGEEISGQPSYQVVGRGLALSPRRLAAFRLADSRAEFAIGCDGAGRPGAHRGLV